MNHQPFEQWLFSEEPLSPDQSRALQAHLETCESCRQLSAAWSGVQTLFEEVTPIEPSPGFTIRWRARQKAQLRQERYKKERQQSWITLMVSIAGAVLFLGLMVTQIFATVETPTQLLFIWIFRVTDFVSMIIAAGDLMVTIMDITFGLVAPVYWAAVAAGLGLLSLLWIFSLHQVFQHRRITP